MVQTAKRVGENRTRETFGRYYEDFGIGEIYEHRPGRTISETDNTWFTLLTMNTHPMHFDAEYAKASEFGKCIVCSPLTVALADEVSSHADMLREARHRAVGIPGDVMVQLQRMSARGETQQFVL